jgi:molecular chaperone DnaK
MAADNKLLGQFDLVGIPPAPRGVPQIEVTFDIDANGIVHVSAKDKATGKEQQIRIQASGGLTDDDIKRMVKEAEENAGEDKKKRESVEVKNRAEALVHTAEKTIKDAGDKLPEDDRKAVEDAIADLRGVMGGDNLDAIRTKTEALQEASMKLGEYLYRAEQEAGAQAAPEAAPSDDGAQAPEAEIVDADFTEVDDDKRSTKH